MAMRAAAGLARQPLPLRRALAPPSSLVARRPLASSTGAASALAIDGRVGAAERRRAAGARWRDGGAFFETLGALGRGGAPAEARAAVRVAVVLGLRRGTVSRGAHVAAAIKAFGRARDGDGVAWLLGEAATRGIALDLRSANAALRAYATARDGRRAAALLDAMERRGPAPDGLSYAAAVDAARDAGAVDALLARAGALGVGGDGTARVAFRAAARLARNDWRRAADLVLRRYEREGGVTPEAGDYALALKACAVGGRPEEALELLGAAEARGAADGNVAAAAVAACASGGDVAAALAVVEARGGARAPEAVVVAGLRALADRGDAARAAEVLDAMDPPTVAAFAAAVDAHRGDADACLDLLRRCRGATGAPPDAAVVGGVLEALSREAGRSGDAAELLEDAAREGAAPDDRCVAAAMRAHIRDGDWRGALAVFEARGRAGARSRHAALEACVAGGDHATAKAVALAAAPPDPQLLRDAARACVAARDFGGAADCAARAAKPPRDDRRAKALAVDVHGLSFPLALGAVVAAARGARHDPAPTLVVLTGKGADRRTRPGVLKPRLERALADDLGLRLGDAGAHAGVLVVPRSAVAALQARYASGP